MKTLYYTLIVTLFSYGSLLAQQWQSNGNNIYNTNTGNVGIDTNNPLSKLHVSYNGSNGASGLSGYAILAQANSGQATLGAEGQGDIYANLNLGTNISGTRRFWHISKRTSQANHSLQYFFFDGASFNSPLFTFSTDGSLGIGINNPLSKLHVSYNGSNGASGLSGYAILAQANSGQATLGAEGQGDIYANLNLGTNISGTRRFWHISKRTSQANHSLQYFFFDGASFNSPLFTFSTDGSLGIGTTTPDAKLAVNGDIHTQEVRVDMIGWPDFVFKEDYTLPTLDEVETHIKENGHLKDIPSEAEVKANGINLGEMDARLLQKIEELTLYTIEQDKTLKLQQQLIKSQQEQLQLLQQQNEQLLKRIETLENK